MDIWQKNLRNPEPGFPLFFAKYCIIWEQELLLFKENIYFNRDTLFPRLKSFVLGQMHNE